MTWITDDSGRRWVALPVRKRRASPKGRRFADVRVGDWLEGGEWGRVDVDYNGRKIPKMFFLVTDHWFDPVAGQEDAEKGALFAIARLTGLDNETGEPCYCRKSSFTRYGLASQGYHYSSIHDPVALLKATFEGVQAGSVVSIGSGKRNRPRIGRDL